MVQLDNREENQMKTFDWKQQWNSADQANLALMLIHISGKIRQPESTGQVENTETETEVRKPKYGTEVRKWKLEVKRKATYRCLVHECAL